jgi:hypothetical protein
MSKILTTTKSLFFNSSSLKFQRSHSHEIRYHFRSDLCFPLGVFYHRHLDDINQFFLHLTGQHFARAIIGINLLQSLVVLEEERQILTRDIHGQIGSFLSLFFESGSSTTEGVFIDFIFDLKQKKIENYR